MEINESTSPHSGRPPTSNKSPIVSDTEDSFISKEDDEQQLWFDKKVAWSIYAINFVYVISKLLLAAMLMGAVEDHEHQYYVVLCAVIFIFCCLYMLMSYVQKHKILTLIFAIIISTFFIGFKAHFERETWQVVDVFSSLFIFSTSVYEVKDLSMKKLKSYFTTNIYRKILGLYIILSLGSLLSIGYYHSYKEHRDIGLAIIFPPWAVYRGVEAFFHEYPTIGNQGGNF